MIATVESIVQNDIRSTEASHVVASLDHVTKKYRDGVQALNRASLELRSGQIVALLGPNGAGKSTAVKLMMGLTSPTAGDVRVFGRDPRLAINRRRVGVMLQVGNAPAMLRVREHIDLMRGYYPHPLPFAEIVRAAGLKGIENKMFGTLSGGQKQRVLFALAIAGDPDLIFLDEPTVGLDIEARRGLWSEIRSLRARGKTVLLTTHYLEEADALADHIIVLNKGTVVCQGSPAEIKAAGSGVALQGGRAKPRTTYEAANPAKVLRFETQLSRNQVMQLRGVERVEGEGSLVVTSSNPEATLRELLALDQTLRGLEVVSPALDDAFLALTANE